MKSAFTWMFVFVYVLNALGACFNPPTEEKTIQQVVFRAQARADRLGR